MQKRGQTPYGSSGMGGGGSGGFDRSYQPVQQQSYQAPQSPAIEDRFGSGCVFPPLPPPSQSRDKALTICFIQRQTILRRPTLQVEGNATGRTKILKQSRWRTRLWRCPFREPDDGPSGRHEERSRGPGRRAGLQRSGCSCGRTSFSPRYAADSVSGPCYPEGGESFRTRRSGKVRPNKLVGSSECRGGV